MDNGFLVASTARRPGDETPDLLFVGEVTPHNAERPWLAIRGNAASIEAAEAVAVLLVERP